MPKYQTKQRATLIAFLDAHADEQLSAAQIAAGLAHRGISVSAVYRNLAALEQDGMVHRHVKGGSREVFYQYTAAAACQNELHLSCKQCGKTFHMHAPDADRLVENLQASADFALDKEETVLIGVCRDCRREATKT